MKKKLIYSGFLSWLLAAFLVLLNLTSLQTSFGDTFQVNIGIYPATFFALLGLLLVFLGLKPLWRSE